MSLGFYSMSPSLGIYSRIITLNSENASHTRDTHCTIVYESKIPEKPEFLKIREWLDESIGENAYNKILSEESRIKLYLGMETLMFEQESRKQPTSEAKTDRNWTNMIKW